MFWVLKQVTSIFFAFSRYIFDIQPNAQLLMTEEILHFSSKSPATRHFIMLVIIRQEDFVPACG